MSIDSPHLNKSEGTPDRKKEFMRADDIYKGMVIATSSGPDTVESKMRLPTGEIRLHMESGTMLAADTGDEEFEIIS